MLLLPWNLSFYKKFLLNSDFRPCIICFNTHEDKPVFLSKFLLNSDFRPSVICFNTHEENLKCKYKSFWVLLRKIYFHAFLECQQLI